MSKNINACLSHNTDNWRTPSAIYNSFMKYGFVDLFEYCSSYDQYDKDYHNQRLFCNPPFSDLKNVIPYLIKQCDNGCDIWLLMPVRTDTKYFSLLVNCCRCHIFFFTERLHFNDSNSAPFPSMLVHIWNKNDLRSSFNLVV